jgi:DnaJ family protein B protein 4
MLSPSARDSLAAAATAAAAAVESERMTHSQLPRTEDEGASSSLSLLGSRTAASSAGRRQKEPSRSSRRRRCIGALRRRASATSCYCFFLLAIVLSYWIDFAGSASSSSSWSSSSSSSSRRHHRRRDGPRTSAGNSNHDGGSRRHGGSKGGEGKSLYEWLGAPKDSTPEQLQKCYRRACLRSHPDKPGGSEDDFKEVSRAYEVLSDPGRRALYDRFGEAGLKHGQHGQQQQQPHRPPFGGAGGGGGGGGPSWSRSSFSRDEGPFQAEFFSSAFGGGPAGPSFASFGGDSGGGGPRAPRSSPSLGTDWDELLRQMMAGQGGGGGFAAGRRQDRDGRRARSASYERPVECTLEELYRGATKRLRVSFGKTSSSSPSSSSRVYAVEIRPGYRAGTRITFPAAGEFPEMVFVVRERPHPAFARRGDDLVYRHRLPAGSFPRRPRGGAATVPLKIPMLDGTTWIRELDAASGLARKGRSITVPGLGMPVRKGGGGRGNLIIEFI